MNVVATLVGASAFALLVAVVVSWNDDEDSRRFLFAFYAAFVFGIYVFGGMIEVVDLLRQIAKQ